MFEKWVVVCCTTQHMDTFTGVVTDAGGKAELFPLEAGKTKPAELIVHLDKMGPKYIILAPNVDDSWHDSFRRHVEERIGIKFAGQNEFLDAILMADAKLLRRPYEGQTQIEEFESVEQPGPPPSTEVPKESQSTARRTRGRGREDKEGSAEPVQEPAPEQKAAAESSGRRTQLTQTRTSRYISQIKNDDSDDDFTPLPAPSSSNMSAKPGTQSFRGTQTPRGVSFSQVGQGMRGTQLSVISESQGQSQGMKRRSLPSDDDDEEIAMDKILPGQAALKKRKIEEETAAPEPSKPAKSLPSSSRQRAEPAPPPPKPEPIKEEDEDIDMKTAKGKRKIAESKVIKTAQEIRRKQEAEAALEDGATDLTAEEIAAVAKMRDLAIVEVFDVTPRADRPITRSQAYGDESSRWDESWNGRKNFKKFKRRTRNGDSEGPMRRMGGQIMVQLVEHKAPDYGIGESYWLEGSAASKKKNTVSQVSNNLSHVSETQLLLAPGPRSSRQVHEISDDSDVQIEEEETNRDDPPVTRRSQADKSQPTTQNTQSKRTNTRSSAAVVNVPRSTVNTAATQNSTLRSKRTTSHRNSASEGPIKKKPKTKSSMFHESDEDSDDDELKFKFK
ncbi:hypothetical protein ABW19_dt0200449 [Dactylella cylindrospora]|nr:hypothetical protein ABW19_dt0200449 [Dactylella cylindrospora]